MLKKWMCVLWAMAMILATAGEAEAKHEYGTIRIIPQCSGQPVTDGTVSLCRVGTVTEDGWYLTDGLADWSVDERDLNSGEWIGLVSGRYRESRVVSRIDGEKGAVFTDLEKGVYLVQQLEGNGRFLSFEPFFLTMPEGESWDVYRAPKVMHSGKSPKTGDYPAPIIGAMGISLSVVGLILLADKYGR